MPCCRWWEQVVSERVAPLPQHRRGSWIIRMSTAENPESQTRRANRGLFARAALNHGFGLQVSRAQGFPQSGSLGPDLRTFPNRRATALSPAQESCPSKPSPRASPSSCHQGFDARADHPPAATGLANMSDKKATLTQQGTPQPGLGNTSMLGGATLHWSTNKAPGQLAPTPRRSEEKSPQRTTGQPTTARPTLLLLASVSFC